MPRTIAPNNITQSSSLNFETAALKHKNKYGRKKYLRNFLESINFFLDLMKFKYKEMKVNCLCYNLWVEKCQVSLGDTVPLIFQKELSPGK